MRQSETAANRGRGRDAHDSHDTTWRIIIDNMARDVRFAVRGLGRNPAFTIAAAATIAIGIGATTVVVSIAYAVLLQPLPVAEPDRLVSIWELHGGGASQSMEGRMLPYERYHAYKEATGEVLAGLAAHHYATLSLRVGDEAESVAAVLTSGNYFQVLGLRPAAGAFYTEDHERSVVLSSALWQRRFDGDPDVIGQTVYIDGRPFVVAGVAPEEFSGTAWGFTRDLWVLAYDDVRDLSGEAWVVPIGRLQPGLELDRARQQIDQIARAIPNERWREVQGARLDPLTWHGNILPGVERFMRMLIATGLLVLLIAGANIAGMLMARAIDRRREVAVRLALGAGRAQLVRQLLAESLLLFLIGGTAGIVVASLATRLLSRIDLPIAVPTLIDVSPGLAVLTVAAVLVLTTSVLVGLGPALRASRVDLATTLKDGLTVSGGRTGRRRNVFVVAQLALSVLLLVTAGLFTRSLRQGLDTDLGFDPTGVVAATIDLGRLGYDEERSRAFFEQLLARMRTAPGIESVALARYVLLGGENASSGAWAIDSEQSEATPTNAGFTIVDTAYVSLMRVDLVAGRGFTSVDHAGSPAVAVIDETLAQQLWPGENAIGKRFRFRGDTAEVVGVTPDVKYISVTEEKAPFVFLPFEHEHSPRMVLHVRSDLAAGAMFEQIQREVSALDANLAIEGGRVLDRVVQVSLFPQRFAAALTGLFGLVGLVLAAIGVYGVLAMHVAQRSQEFGIRMALGARQGDVLRLVLARGAVLAVAGAVIGLVLASGLTRAVRSFLFGVSPLDPISYAAVASLLIGVALAASYVPARRATAADLLAVLRQE